MIMISPPLPHRNRSDYEIDLYKDNDGTYRWRMTELSTQEIVGAAEQGYSLGGCVLNCYTVTAYLPDGFDLTTTWPDDIDGVRALVESGK